MAITINPGHLLAYYNRGIDYLALKDYASAEADFSTYLRFVPIPKAYVARGEARAERGNRTGALADYDEAIARYKATGDTRAAADVAARVKALR